VRLAALVLLLALLLSGCARRERTSALGTASGKIVLDFWNGFTGPDGKTMERIVRQFQKENPDVGVRMQLIPWATYYDKLTLSLAYRGAPDVFVVHAGRLPEFASFDTLQPLDALMAAAEPPLPKERFAPAPWNASFYAGKQVALPLDVHPIVLYCNTRLLQEAGVPEPPRTWDAFLEAARKMTKDTDRDDRPDQWGFVFTWQRSNWLTFAYQFGGGVLSPDYKSCAMESPESLAATRRMCDLVYTHRVAPKPEGIDAWLAFRQGKVGMALEGLYMLSTLEEQKNFPFVAAPAPQFGPKPGAWGGSHLLCQPAGITPERSRAAWRLMRYLSDHSLAWAKGGQVPARLDLQRSPEFAAMPAQSAAATQLPYIQYDPLTPKMNAIFPFVDPAIEAALLGLQTPEGAMRDACRRIAQVLKRP
jgi:multiple sugar transport system substrate-binding protein